MDFSRFVLRFRFFGVDVRVAPSFWFLCVFFSPFLGNAGADRPWLFGLLGWTAAVLAAFLTHEFGHALVARRLFGVKPSVDLGVGFLPSGLFLCGGLTTWRPVYAKAPGVWRRVAVLVAGAGAGFIGAGLLTAVGVL
ncbi:MAG: hypothetical protein HUK22_01455, partial [Thermoguttaceae bacterium]|nr:hypothetical protein [Thermoguttaceae bacterium]